MRTELAIVVCGALLVGCGDTKSDSSEAKKDVEIEFTTATVSVAEKDSSAGLSLVADATFSAEVTGCVSGWSDTGLSDATAQPINIPKSDVGCIFKLTSLSYNSESFTFAPVINWSAGQSFISVGSLGTELSFNIVSALPDAPAAIGDSEAIEIQFGTFVVGTAASGTTQTTAGVTVAGAEALNLEVSNVGITIDGTDGHGIFDVTLECGSPVVAGVCDGVDLSQVRVFLGNNAAVADPTSLAECVSSASSGSVGHDIVATGNGGLSTSSSPLAGPAALYTAGNEDLILILSYDSGSGQSCKYFDISVVAPSN